MTDRKKQKPDSSRSLVPYDNGLPKIEESTVLIAKALGLYAKRFPQGGPQHWYFEKIPPLPMLDSR